MVCQRNDFCPWLCPERDRRGAKIPLIYEEFAQQSIFVPQRIWDRAGVNDEKRANFSGNHQVLENGRDTSCENVVPKMVAERQLPTIGDRRNSRLVKELLAAVAGKQFWYNANFASHMGQPALAARRNLFKTPRKSGCREKVDKMTQVQTGRGLEVVGNLRFLVVNIPRLGLFTFGEKQR